MTAPHRYDLHTSSCINKETQMYNRKLQKIMKSMDHTVVLDTTLIKNDYTRHRLHLNMSGKERMAALIDKTVKLILTKQKESSTCIPLPWKKNFRNTTTRQNAINSMSSVYPS
jgi:hypothetical protein